MNFLFKNIGIILNLAGTTLVAISFGSYPEKNDVPNTTDNKGQRKKYIAHFNYPSLFKIGLGLIFLGFILQLKFE